MAEPIIYRHFKPTRNKFYTVTADIENVGLIVVAKTRYSKHAEMIAKDMQQLTRHLDQQINSINLDI